MWKCGIFPASASSWGANGTGKSSLFSVFEFLKDSLTANVNTALMRLGGSRGFAEVRSRDSQGPIEIELKFRTNPDGPLTTYLLRIDEKEGRALVVGEVLKYRRGSRGRPLGVPQFFRRERNRGNERTR